MPHFTIPTNRKREIVDITDAVAALVPAATGIAFVNVLHTTAALTDI